MEKKPKISILIPVYQAEQYLERCLDSALHQSYSNVEIVMVDDGSTDGSAKAAGRYTDQSNVSYYLEEHRGVSHTRQLLIQRAKGDYFFFLDADDYIDPRTLEILYDLAVSNAADIVQCKIIRTQADCLEQTDYNNLGIQVFTSLEKVIESWHYNVWQSMLAAKLYKKAVFDNTLFPAGKIHEDEAVMHRLLGNSNVVVSTTLPLYYYYKNPDSVMNRPFTYARYDGLDALQDRIDFYRERGLVFQADMVCLWYCFICVELYRRTYQEISPADPHLPALRDQYRNMAQYVLATGRFDRELREKLNQWFTIPLEGELPYYWPIAKAYYEEHARETGRDK